MSDSEDTGLATAEFMMVRISLSATRLQMTHLSCIGWWLRAKRHGMGTYALLGTKYIGEWLSDQMNGQGKLFYMNGSVYSGAFADGKPSGNGTVIDENGNTYEGRWQRGVKSGRGKLTFVDGSVYIGDFAMDRIEGSLHGTPSPSRQSYWFLNQI